VSAGVGMILVSLSSSPALEARDVFVSAVGG